LELLRVSSSFLHFALFDEAWPCLFHHYGAENFRNDNTLPSSILKALKRTMAAEYSRAMGRRVFVGQERGTELGFKQGGTPGYGLRRLMICTRGQPKKILSRGEFKSLRADRVTLVLGPIEEVECAREMYRLVIKENRSSYVTDVRVGPLSGLRHR
jgi:hypothetical protein